MSHNIENSQLGENASVFVVGEPAWHRLGKRLDEPQTAEKALKLANLDFDVITTPSLYEWNGETRINQGQFATVRTDTGVALGGVGAGYKPIQNRDAFKFFDPLVGEGSAIYHSAGVLGKGERVWIMAKLPSYINVGKGDDVELNVILTNRHDGHGSMLALLSPVRVVCENTLNSAIGNHNGLVRIKHTTNADKYIEQAHKVLGIMVDQSKLLEEAFKFLTTIKVNKKIENDFVNFCIPSEGLDKPATITENNRIQLIECIHTSAGHDLRTASGTAWGLFNGLTNFLDYHTKSKNDSLRLNSIWFGRANNNKATAMNYLLNLSKNAPVNLMTSKR